MSTSGDSRSSERSADNFVPNSRKVFYTASTNQNDAVFLEVMAFARNVCSYFDTTSQSNTSNFSQSRIRFLWCMRIHTSTYPTSLRGTLQCGGLSLGRFGFAALADQLLNCRHQIPLIRQHVLRVAVGLSDSKYMVVPEQDRLIMLRVA